MSDDQIRVGRKQEHISASGTHVLSYFVEMSHEGLNEHKISHSFSSFLRLVIRQCKSLAVFFISPLVSYNKFIFTGIFRDF